MQKLTPCLWFDDRAEEAAQFYTSVFKNSKILAITRFPEGAPRPAGMVMTVTFRLDGQEFMALNGGPEFKFTEAVSMIVNCATQGEIDAMWSELSAGGQEVQCGWLKDKFGLSWQVVPVVLGRMLRDKSPAKRQRVVAALHQMKKLDIRGLENAFAGR